MIVEKFSEFSNKNNNKTIIDYIESILLNLYKGYSFKFASNGVFCFGKDNSSVLFFNQDSYLNIQKLFKKTELIKNIGGYNIYLIPKKLENPFFNDSNKLESHFYFRESDYFKKIKYFISKIFNLAEEIEIYPVIKWEGCVVEVLIKSDNLTDKEYLLANKISDIWNNLL